MKMTPYNRARLAITVLFGFGAFVSGVQFSHGEGSLSTHFWFVICTCILGLRVIYSFVKGTD